MAIPVLMPKQGQSVETCIITKWFKKKGETVNSGDILFSYETDKAAFDVESPANGILLDIFYGNGAEVPVLVNVAVIGQAGEETASFGPSGNTSPEVSVEKAAAVTLAESTPEKGLVEKNENSKRRISPRAKKLAGEKGLNYNEITGSGPNGRIVFADIEKALSGLSEAQTPVLRNVVDQVPSYPQSQSVTGEFTEQPLSNVRRLIAKAMHSSLQNSAQLTHHMSADVRRLLEARKKIKEDLAAGRGKHDITLNDMVCWCVIRALEKFPEANSHFLGDKIKTFNRIHLGVAVDTPRGLMVPAVRNADQMHLAALSGELKAVADACRKGSINPELIQSTSASFTVSNLGNYGVEIFTPVINLPQAAILGVCTIINRPADLGNGIFGFVPYMGLSLTYDHRAIDGGPATLFLREIKDQIENFKM